MREDKLFFNIYEISKAKNLNNEKNIKYIQDFFSSTILFKILVDSKYVE